jgi:hypothetical protein
MYMLAYAIFWANNTATPCFSAKRFIKLGAQINGPRGTFGKDLFGQ